MLLWCSAVSYKVDMEHYVELVTKFLDVAHAFWRIFGKHFCVVQNGQKFIAETHKNVVVLFSDIVGFTTLSYAPLPCASLHCSYPSDLLDC